MEYNRPPDRHEIIKALYSISTFNDTENALCIRIGRSAVCRLAADLLEAEYKPQKIKGNPLGDPFDEI